jgi:hypothetical protein
VSSETLAPGVKVRETADRETPARAATCSALTKDFGRAGPGRRDSERFFTAKAAISYAIACNTNFCQSS